MEGKWGELGGCLKWGSNGKVPKMLPDHDPPFSGFPVGGCIPWVPMGSLWGVGVGGPLDTGVPDPPLVGHRLPELLHPQS